MIARPRYLPDNFTLALAASIGLASLFPSEGSLDRAVGNVTAVAVSLLFFLHGARLSRQSIIAGAMHWLARR